MDNPAVNRDELRKKIMYQVRAKHWNQRCEGVYQQAITSLMHTSHRKLKKEIADG